MNHINPNPSRISKIINKISHTWDKIVDYYHLIKMVRFSLFIALVVLLFVMVPQGKEALIAMMENAEGSHYAQRNYFIITTVMLALMCWYYARVLYQFDFADQVTQMSKHKKFKRHFPRWLGFFMIMVPAFSILIVTKNGFKLFLYMFLTANLFLFFVYARRKLFNLEPLSMQKKAYKHLNELPTHTIVILILFLVLNWFLLFLFTLYGQSVSIAIGATAVVMLALTTLISVGSSITFMGERKGIPLLLMVVMVAVLTSAFMDNHKIRLIPNNTIIEKPQTSMIQHFSQWYQKRINQQQNNKPIPVFFVATEGGGIRAAYWTAIVLGRLQDLNPEFSKHIYAISGVSGGSLGASVFDALLAQSQHMEITDTSDCMIENKNNNNYYCRSKRILAEDFLSPTVANMMFSDFFQRFCFFCKFNDRAQALEQSWERSWKKEWQQVDNVQDYFEQPFQSIWSKDKEMQIPQLLLNSTIVETGQRIIATSLPLSRRSFADTFHDSVDTFAEISKTMRISTTALTSARFSYVSPAGTLYRDKTNKKWIRLVDGGYFENSGAIAIGEIINSLNDSYIANNKIIPIVIHISNEPGYPKRKNEGNKSQTSMLSEVLSPLISILAVRTGKGQEARIALKYLVSKHQEANVKNYFHFKLKKSNSVQLPLGWMLSNQAMLNMDEQLADQRQLLLSIDEILSHQYNNSDVSQFIVE